MDKYYDAKKLICSYPSAYYYVIISERSNGKTYSALAYGAENWLNKGEQFAYVRRFKEDTKAREMGQLFAAHNSNDYIRKKSKSKYDVILYEKGKFFAGIHGEERPILEEEPMGFVFDISSMEHYKSVSYPKITTIIFDEFISRKGYLNNEFVLFMNTISTIVRNRSNVKIIMLGNTVNRYCPYYAEMGLTNIVKQKQGTVDVYKYGGSDLEVVVDYVKKSEKGKMSDVYFAFDNPELKMITTGEWEIGVYPHLTKKIKYKDIVFSFFIEFDTEMLQCDIVSTLEDTFISVHKKTTPIKNLDTDIVYSTRQIEGWNRRVGIENQTDKLSIVIRKCLQANKIFYGTNEDGEVFRNYLMWCSKEN